jgi:hypothetical protein
MFRRSLYFPDAGFSFTSPGDALLSFSQSGVTAYAQTMDDFPTPAEVRNHIPAPCYDFGHFQGVYGRPPVGPTNLSTYGLHQFHYISCALRILYVVSIMKMFFLLLGRRIEVA